jgi:hypothetical protein
MILMTTIAQTPIATPEKPPPMKPALNSAYFPINCDYSIAQILDRDFLPEPIE